MNYLHYIDGDVTDSQSPGNNQVIAHVCNESGIWSGRKSIAIARRWPQTRRTYRQCYLGRRNSSLGSVQFVNVDQSESDELIRVANMIARTDVKHPVSYRALRRCLKSVARKAIKIRASVHMPRLFDDQNDNWPDLELIIYNTLCTARISVYVYNCKKRVEDQWLPGTTNRSTSWLTQDSRN